MNEHFYVYVLHSGTDNNLYTGYTQNLQNRLDQHQKGTVESTKRRRPLTLVYWEGCLNQKDALQREKYLKTAWGKRYLKNRLMNYLTG